MALLSGVSMANTFHVHLYSKLANAAPNLNPEVLQSALTAYECARVHGIESSSRLAVIDFSLPSSEQRLWIFDLESQELVLRDLVAHGKNSGLASATAFSNIEGSHQSSLGLFMGSESYRGQHGYSLRLDGLEPGVNDLARQRAIVIHGADYVDQSWVAEYGRIGRSHGCPAVSQGTIREVVDNLKGGQLVFSYYPDQEWLASSAFLNCKSEARLAEADSPLGSADG
ncbi:MAG: murein L,D-transpeptidase catalytic domain family protein [Marinobacter sp.]|nr:murein L,D-transpeptidase catalytic domain family protein [Marinobacter sp.]MDX1756072.1 murein L,D-transpeptidase catalytic domain family protein [Marinobacter sp.]